MRQDFPWKYFDVLFDVARLRIREPHDYLEELLTVRLRFRHSERAEPFQIATDPVLLLDGKSDVYQRL